ncbi:ASPIC and UnbV [Planctomycetes bacterium Poly30]|uniref:ASPIC and UnbV n=1 Tax=Saltatorellus ferox TaxID=2528018 RepID=A0A518ELM4_9BACT|nr:ASPIC and UnbV [Planctomycetes bacterium Poly30]
MISPSAALRWLIRAHAGLLLSSAGATPQVVFLDRTDLLETSDVRSGIAMGVADMNGDGRDDIVRLHEGRGLRIEYQGAPGAAFGTLVHGNVSLTRQWSLSIADADHNGYRDLFLGGAYDGARVLFADSTGSSFAPTVLPGPPLFVKGSQFVDINADGWLDLFVGHGEADSHLYRNTGGGGFEFDPEWIGAPTDPSSDGSGYRASVFTDYDGDGDVDLHVSKGRDGVASPDDSRRINQLFRNDGQAWTEVGEVAGVALGEQSWAAEFGDLDGDGDMDAFVLNEMDASSLLRNNGDGTFTDVTRLSGLAGELGFFGVQAAFRDFDNDGHLDLLVSGEEHRLFLGDGALGFTRVAAPFPGPSVSSFALGDLNGDGFVDVYAGYAGLVNLPSSEPDRLFFNVANGNDWLQVSLVGTTSDLGGVGARIEVRNDGALQVREVRAGEGFGGSHSPVQSFGLGAADSVDRVRVLWPSGAIDELWNVDVNQRLEIVEGATGVRDVAVALIGLEFNDAEESEGGEVWLRNRDLELVEDGLRGDQIVGLRYALDVPPGATVVDAWVQFTAEGRDFDEAQLFIAAEATDDAAGIESLDMNLSLRPRTTSVVPWSPVSWTEIGRRSSAERTPSLRSVIQELADRDGWNEGNHALLLITGTGRRSAYASDDGLSVLASGVNINPNAPTLHVLYTDHQVTVSAVRGPQSDGEERESGYVTLTSFDLELVDDGSNLGQTVALHFEDVAVPRGARIERAYIQFTADEVGLGSCLLSVSAEASGHPAPLEAVDGNFTSRTRTAASVPWPVLPWEQVGDATFAQRTPDLRPIVQELVNRVDWGSGSDTVFLISGTGTRTAESFEGGAASSPKLIIEFSTRPGNVPPTADAGGDIVFGGSSTGGASPTSRRTPEVPEGPSRSECSRPASVD